MKKLLLLICLCAALILPQSLKQVVTQSHPSFYGFYFSDENDGWGVGLNENIWKTTNGGFDWEKVYDNPASVKTLYSIQFFDANTGLAAGGSSSGSVILKTTDGGNNWQEITSPVSSYIYKMFFSDMNTGWMLNSSSSASKILKTTDGGTNWTIVMEHNTGDLQSMHMLPSGKGVAGGGGSGKLDLYYTADGTTWTKAPAPSLGGFTYTRTDIRGVFMVNDNLAYACGWGSAIGAQPSIFLKSTDGGANWTYLTQAPENRIYQNMYTLTFKDENNGLAFGGGGYEGSIVARTTDGGVNWIPVQNGMGYTVRTSYVIGDKVWIAGTGGVGYCSNYGESWQLLSRIAGSTLYSLKVAGDNIIATGYDGIVLRSTDKGYTWNSNYAAVGNVCNSINDLYMVNSSLGFAARNNRLVSKTTDGGISWTKVLTDSNVATLPITGTYFFDENTGFAVGRVGTNVDAIYKTTDGGLTWNLKTNTVQKNLNDIIFTDQNNGVIVANDSKIVYTSDAGSSWQAAPIKDLPVGLEVDIYDVEFSSPSYGVAVGEKSVFITENGGVNWTYIEIPEFTKTLRSVAFKTSQEWYAVGDVYILFSSDGGNTWTNINDTLLTGKSTFRGVGVDSEGHVWIGSGNSTIYTTNPLTAVDDQIPYPLDFTLNQNYPNPFNPSTSIKYSLTSESKVTIRIYDILGSIFSELVNERKPAGEYTINFDGGFLSSGVYFCVMNAGGKVITRKMILIK
jgi:photosystem II stability/assembly factor-like uncharacterized protein